MTAPVFFDQVMTVYARNATTEQYTDVAASGVACRLNFLRTEGPPTMAERAELAAHRVALWDEAVPIDEDAQIEVAGVVGPDGTTLARWNLIRGTQNLLRDPLGDPHFWRAFVVRAT